MQTRPDIFLSTGAVVRCTRMANGATSADKLDGKGFTPAEWEEFCTARVRADLRATLDAAADKLATFPKGPQGLTPDAVKFSPAFQAAARAYDRAHAALRTFNAQHKPPHIPRTPEYMASLSRSAGAPANA